MQAHLPSDLGDLPSEASTIATTSALNSGVNFRRDRPGPLLNDIGHSNPGTSLLQVAVRQTEGASDPLKQ